MNESDSRSSIQDAVHGTMNFDYLTEDIKDEKLKTCIQSIIQAPTFQRLRHISQLGMANLIYPTANHDRFSHSLGAAYIASQVLKRLEIWYGKDREKKDLIDSDVKKYAFFGTLLHDIGHGPFSHAFEGLLSSGNAKIIKHEHWTEMFLKEEKEFSNTLELELGLDVDVLIDLITGRWRNRKKDKKNRKDYGIAADIISSQMDVDRCDYLLRDSYFTGVPYNKIDLGWLINHLCIFSAKELKEGAARLGIQQKGVTAAAHLLLSRYRLHRVIYLHKKVQLLETLLIMFFRQLAQLLKEDKICLSEYSVGIFLKKYLVNAYDFSNMSEALQKEARKDFITENYKYYKNLTDYDVWMLVRDFAVCSCKSKGPIVDLNAIARAIYNRDLHRAYPIKNKKYSKVSKKIQKKGYDWRVIPLELKVKAYDISKDPIWVQTVASSGKRKHADLVKKSSLLSGISKKRKTKTAWLMVYDNKDKSVINKLKKDLGNLAPTF
ncbi:MAG: hypothetical protein Tsb0018_07600 [Opitutales bacterium]|tara:strand:- start:584 stop:2059 length:1476 start_codon:yes stop_codon:yes gene_type:complete